MQTNLLWTGREYESLENCVVTTTQAGSEVHSVIVGMYAQKIYRVEYFIKTNPAWETVRFDVRSQHSDRVDVFNFQSDGKGNWTTDGTPKERFKGCIDVDIPLTPFTNTLPINRLKLAPGQTQQIRVLYIDLLAGEIKPVWQLYTKLSENEYHYENVPNDFEATITTDEWGLVVDYPGLFVRTARLESNYR